MMETHGKSSYYGRKTDSINSKEHIYPQVKIITGTKFRRLVLPSETSAEC